MSQSKVNIDLSHAKLIKVTRCAKKTCNHNIENKCKAFDGELAEKGCFLRFTGAKVTKNVENLDEVFK
jgi:hypothetical protein